MKKESKNPKVYGVFESKSDFDNWFNNNCNKCTVPKCHIKRSVRSYLELGYLTLNRLNQIGYDGVKLNFECDRFIDTKKNEIPKHEKLEIIEDFLDIFLVNAF